MLNISNLSFSFEEKNILQNFTLRLKKGESGALIGASGSGKSTLLKILTGLLKPMSGTFQINDCTLPQGLEHVAYMMQEDMLLPWRTVYGNMSLSMELGTKPVKIEDFKEKVTHLMHSLGLVNCENLYPDELSGGMKQRVSLARTLILNRPTLLLDEPFGSLDVVLREQIYTYLRSIKRRYLTTILMVTHDFRDAMALADRIFLLHDGQIVQEWTVCDRDRNDPEITGKLLQQLREAFHGLNRPYCCPEML